MSDLNELVGIIERARTDGAAPITITGDTFLALVRLSAAVGGTANITPALLTPQAPPAVAEVVAEDETVSIKDICDRLKVSRTTLYNWRRDGTFDIKPVNVAGTKWLRTDFIAWLRGQRS